MKISINSMFLLVFFCLTTNAHAWWNKDWDYRKEFNFDTSVTGLPIEATVNEAAILVKLHLGNFTYFADTLPAGEDIRFISGDDITPLKHHIEYYDPLQQIGLIWVKVPRITPGTNLEKIYMYYGNSDAIAGDDKPATYAVDDVLVYHFDTPAADATAYANNPQLDSSVLLPGAAIGQGVEFAGGESIVVPASPSLRLLPDPGVTVSLWAKIIAAQSDTVLFSYTAESGDSMALKVDGVNPYLQYTVADEVIATPIIEDGELMLDSWSHLAFTVAPDSITLFVNGVALTSIDTQVAEMGGSITVGAAADNSAGFVGQLDQLHILKRVATPDWLALTYMNQGPSDLLLVAGADGQQEGAHGGHNPLAFSLSKLTLEGKITTGSLMLMLIYGLYIMFAKGMFLVRVKKSNTGFNQQYQADSSDVFASLEGVNSLQTKISASTLNGVYQIALKQLQLRLANKDKLNTSEMNSIRSGMDTVMLRQTQRLNSQMVLLTIAIAGGPFIGLFGTVMGVMITFADVALAGNVDVNAIAPGIAAALVATVAGLLVAIPCLFGYNYLSGQIKEIVADMRVFADELQSKITEQYGE